jgi:8-oxo-dGTP pyrophosphatase MutT (NUDIX family)
VVTVRDAATVILVRDRRDLEVFVVRRNAALEFAPGATVFPGGAVDDADIVAARERGVDEFRVAAARECLEEAGIPIDPAALVEFARWITPVGAPRRYDTRFFACDLPPGQVASHCGVETVDGVWVTPARAIARFEGGEISLVSVTLEHLKRLDRFTTPSAVLDYARAKPIRTVHSRREGGCWVSGVDDW